jgi:hypothetical protein
VVEGVRFQDIRDADNSDPVPGDSDDRGSLCTKIPRLYHHWRPDPGRYSNLRAAHHQRTIGLGHFLNKSSMFGKWPYFLGEI